jgi:hypothetical protein
METRGNVERGNRDTRKYLLDDDVQRSISYI